MTEPTWDQTSYVEHYNSLYGFSEEEALHHLAPLRLDARDTFVDFGCGNASILSLAARTVKLAIGVDCSAEQVALARKRMAPFNNTRIIEAKFLDCDLTGHRITAAAGRKSLHHLTDEEKGAFFARISPWFEPSARFVIEDGIFSFDRAELSARMPQILQEAPAFYGKKWDAIRPDFLVTLNEEFVTGLPQWKTALAAGGFRVTEIDQRTCFYARVLAIKERA